MKTLTVELGTTSNFKRAANSIQTEASPKRRQWIPEAEVEAEEESCKRPTRCC